MWFSMWEKLLLYSCLECAFAPISLSFCVGRNGNWSLGLSRLSFCREVIPFLKMYTDYINNYDAAVAVRWRRRLWRRKNSSSYSVPLVRLWSGWRTTRSWKSFWRHARTIPSVILRYENGQRRMKRVERDNFSMSVISFHHLELNFNHTVWSLQILNIYLLLSNASEGIRLEWSSFFSCPFLTLSFFFPLSFFNRTFIRCWSCPFSGCLDTFCFFRS